MRAYPKIFAMGKKYIRDILDGDVEVTEKVDGSQFGFGKIDGEVICRSKNKVQQNEAPDKMFKTAVDYILSIEDRLEEGLFYYAEYLNKPKHNNLAYEKTPKNNLVLFGVTDMADEFVSDHKELTKHAENLGIDVVPLLHYGRLTVDNLKGLMDRDSYLGGVKMEGFVVKNYAKPFMMGGDQGVVIPLMTGKYVSEAYKEVAKAWGKGNTSRGKWTTFKESYKTEARWEKAVQHFKEDGKLDESPKDIGPLIKEVHKDISEEDKEEIKDFLWGEFGQELLRMSTAGLPQWYKDKLLDMTK